MSPSTRLDPFEPLAGDEVRVLTVTQAALLPETSSLFSFLSEAERELAARLREGPHREDFQLSRGFLRRWLGGILNVPPSSLRFETLPGGKPILTTSPGLSFSLSHTLGRYAYEIGRAHV